MDRQTQYIIGATILLTVVLLGAGVLLNRGGVEVAEAAPNWADTDVKCLVNGHTNLASHIHPILRISVDGEAESVPANVGYNSVCMAEVHTHDASGQLHVETFEPGKTFTLEDFFLVWDKEFERPGYFVEATLDGEPLVDPMTLQLVDGQVIEIAYRSIEGVVEDNPTDGSSDAAPGE